ncbi:hypothetical protein RM530_04010 [Algiphilus sp. W345]|uniref:Uncharacterized protein n=1 Tax=Banduia mediterranea TaxID=3075609 RepID=A0ABU2WF82_9GAMM|nr:hypothetical protein [Algiphilus sp. W345]MDT0496530.1 hypothetical protein [Algiphilus sp. W345]
MAITLASIALPDDLVWTDEFVHEPVGQALQRTLGGAQIIEETALIAGRPITLGTDNQWITRSTLLTLRALADTAGQIHTLDLRGDEYDVVFRRPAISARPVIEFADPTVDDFYAVQINLITV